MTYEEYLKKKLDRLNENSVYGLMDVEKIDRLQKEACHDLAMIWNVDSSEIAKIVHSYIERGINCDYDLNCPKPPIYIKPVKVKSLKERLEEATMHEDWFDAISYNTYLHKTYQNKKEDNKMKATSVQNIKNVKDVCFDISNNPIERESKLTIVASTNDDIFAFEFEGEDLLQNCKKAGLFTGWEKDQKIRELEKDLSNWKKEAADCLKLRDKAEEEINRKNKEINEYEEKIKKLKHDDEQDKEAADYWSKEHDILLERFAKLQNENEKLKDKLENVEPFRALEQTIREKQQLKEENENLKKHIKRHAENCRTIAQRNDKLRKELALEKATNEAQHKFIREYAGKGTEIGFNYAIDDAKEVSYVIVEKRRDIIKENEHLRAEVKRLREENKRCNKVNEEIGSHAVDLQEEIKELKYQLGDIQATKEVVEQKLNTRAGILDQAKKCVCGQREQDYGTPERNFQIIADLWNGYLGEKTDNPVISVTPVDVSMMMALMKIARIRNGGGSGDSFVDLAGYAACGGEIWHGQKVKDQN